MTLQNESLEIRLTRKMVLGSDNSTMVVFIDVRHWELVEAHGKMIEEQYSSRLARLMLAGLPLPRDAGIYDRRAAMRKATDLAVNALAEARTPEEQATARETLTRLRRRDLS